MDCCCADNKDEKEEGLVVKRRCRDILCLILFISFWVGMFIICGIAFKDGEPNRLVYGVDSYGFTCGSSNQLFNLTFDLTNSRNLYWLNPLDLMSPKTYRYAKTVCRSGCPGQPLCNQNTFPCDNTNQFTCPYYRFAEMGLYGRVPGVDIADISYWDELAYVTNVSDTGAAAFVTKLKSYWMFKDAATQLEGNLSGAYYQYMSMFPGNGPCYPHLYETAPFFYRCFPNIVKSNLTQELVEKVSNAWSSVSNSSVVNEFVNKWNSSAQRWSRYVGDISRGILVIVIGGLAGGLVLSLLWLVVLRYLGGFMVWIAIVFVNLAFVGACLFTWVKAGYIGDSGVGKTILDQLPVEINPAQSEERTWFWIAIGTSIAAGIVLLVTLLCITRIKIAVACVKVASQAVGSMPTVIFFPLLPFVFEVGLVIYWVAVTAMLYSSGELTANCRSSDSSSGGLSFKSIANLSNIKAAISTVQNFDLQDYAVAQLNATLNSATNFNATRDNCYANVSTDARAFLCGRDPNCYLTYDWDNKMKWVFIYHFFGLLWTNQVIIGFTCVTLAGAFAHFYWARGDSDVMPTFPVLTALKNTVFYHLGSIAFGGFIIAIIQLIRFLLEYLDRKSKEIQARNALAEWAMCICKCLMWCIEKIAEFINRNAYIMIGIKGKGYCCSACHAIKIIISNALRVAVVNMVATVLIFLGKVSVAACCGIAAYAMTEAKYYNSPSEYPDTYLYSPVLVIAISAITGFAIAEIFFSVYEMAIDTVILAFCEDCDMHGGNPKYAPPLLAEVMGSVHEPAKKADEAKA